MRLIAPLEDTGGEGEVNIEDGDEDVEPLKIAPSPGQPTPEQVELHRTKGHIPYRSWCKWCVMARGVGQPHLRAGESALPIVGIDYFFVTTGGVKKRDELEIPEDAAVDEARKEGKLLKCVLVRCWTSKNIFAHVIPCKGADEELFTAKLVAADIEWLGHTKLALKADNEAAVKALAKQVVQIIKEKRTAVENIQQEAPPAYDSQSNGGTEIGVRLVRGLFRTLKLCLEARIGKYIPVTHAIVPWLLQHTCTLLNAQTRGPDGLTPWARIKGRAFNQRLMGFGEVVLYKLATKGPHSAPDGNMGTRWREGCFLGYSRSTNTYTIGLPDGGLATSRSLMRRPMDNRWSAEAMSKITATPWSERDRSAPGVRFEQPADGSAEAPRREVASVPKQFRINLSDLREHGFTEGCEQCRHNEVYKKSKGGLQHSEACRKRLLRAIAQTPHGRARIDAYEEKVDQAIADRIEAEDVAQAPPTESPQPREPLPHAEGSAEPANIEAAPRRASHVTQQGVRGGTGLPAEEASPAETPLARPDRPELIDDMFTDGDGVGHGNAMETDAPEDADMGFVGSLEPQTGDVISSILLQQLGSQGRRYKRESRAAYRHLVSEIYSPPRVTAEIKRSRNKHLLPGFAFDLTVVDPDDGQPWDFTRRDKREKARAMLRRQRPLLLIGSPMCTAFCTWQRLNASKSSDPDKMRRAKVAATMHMNFVISLYYEQIEADRYFLHEHPRWATSWSISEMKKLEKVPGVEFTQGDQCQYGAEVRSGKHTGRPVMKPTGFLTNSPKLMQALSKRCVGRNGDCSRPAGGEHFICSGHVSADMAKYPRELCRAVLRGITAQLKEDRRLKPGCYGLQAIDDEEEIAQSMYGPEHGYSGRFRDDLTGQVLRDDLVHAARMVELDYFHSKGVWIKVPKQRARAVTGRQPISVRWVDVNKGDEANPKYRSRLVARQIKALDRSGATYFAPAPPLEALRTVLSMAMTRVGAHQPIWDPSSDRRQQTSFVDVSRAYFNAKVDREKAPCFVALPPEDAESETMCGELVRHMYGTRIAADGWQEEYSTLLVRLGSRQGLASPNVFYHHDRHIASSVHGDDFTSTGPAVELDWLESEIGKEYETTVGPRLGPGPNDAKEARALNRVITWHEDRVEYEADPRQLERLVAECGLEGAKPMVTPGVRAAFKTLEEDEELALRLHTAFRGAAARSNYLAADRIDAQFSCKEICRWMSKPTMSSWAALKRLCRYFNGARRLVYVYRKQQVDAIDVYTDTDWAGCAKTRKSTSGGCVMVGRHAIKHWSSTQPSISLSSGEAEFYGVVRGSGQGLGYQALLEDLGVSLPLRIWTDSSAALGICSRQCVGKLRHLDTHTLWVQQAVRCQRLELKKVLGEENPADLLTKHSISRERLLKLLELYDCEFRDGRAESAPQVRTGDSGRTKIAEADASQEIAVAQEEEEEQPTVPRMPHLEYGRERLDAAYPSLAAPDDEPLDDLTRLEDDVLYGKGMEIAQNIINDMVQHGRRRRTGDGAAPQPEGNSNHVTDEPNSALAGSFKGRMGNTGMPSRCTVPSKPFDAPEEE